MDYNAQKVEIEDFIRNNDSLGHTISHWVETRASHRETSKFRFHVEDTEKITNLLVSLSGRLARTENLISTDDPRFKDQKVNIFKDISSMLAKNIQIILPDFENGFFPTYLPLCEVDLKMSQKFQTRNIFNKFEITK